MSQTNAVLNALACAGLIAVFYVLAHTLLGAHLVTEPQAILFGVGASVAGCAFSVRYFSG